MKLSARSAAWLLPLLLTGCFHKTQVAQNQPLAPPIEDTPPAKPEPSPTNLPPPEVTVPVQHSAGGCYATTGACEKDAEAQETGEYQPAGCVKRNARVVCHRPAIDS